MRTPPFLALAGSLALGEALALAFPAVATLWPWMLAATVLVILFGYGWNVPFWGYAATACLGFSVCSAHLADRQGLVKSAALGRGPFVCEATLREEPRVRGDWCSADVSVGELELRVIFPSGGTRSVASVPSGGTRSVASADGTESVPPETRPQAGDVWRFAGWLERKNPSGFQRRKLWVKGRGTSAACIRPAGRLSPYRILARVRRSLSRRLGIGLDHAPDVADLNRAILLGERRGLDLETRGVFAAAGTTHIFAISGLHVMCVAGVLFGVLVLCGIPMRGRPFVLIPVLWAYVLLVGAAPSAVRAAAMATLCFLAPVFWRKPDGLVAWSVVFIAVHLIRPLQIGHVGSCLSFAVMLTLVLFGRWYGEVVPSRRGAWLAIPLAAWAAGVPIVAVVFGRFTPGAILANLVLIPVAGVSVFASALALGASFLSTALAAYLNNAAALATSVLVGVSRLTAAVPGASAEVSPWTIGECCAWYFVLVAGLYLIRSVVLRRRKSL